MPVAMQTDNKRKDRNASDTTEMSRKRKLTHQKWKNIRQQEQELVARQSIWQKKLTTETEHGKRIGVDNPPQPMTSALRRQHQAHKANMAEYSRQLVDTDIDLGLVRVEKAKMEESEVDPLLAVDPVAVDPKEGRNLWPLLAFLVCVCIVQSSMLIPTANLEPVFTAFQKFVRWDASKPDPPISIQSALPVAPVWSAVVQTTMNRIGENRDPRVNQTKLKTIGQQIQELNGTDLQLDDLQDVEELRLNVSQNTNKAYTIDFVRTWSTNATPIQTQIIISGDQGSPTETEVKAWVDSFKKTCDIRNLSSFEVFFHGLQQWLGLGLRE